MFKYPARRKKKPQQPSSSSSYPTVPVPQAVPEVPYVPQPSTYVPQPSIPVPVATAVPTVPSVPSSLPPPLSNSSAWFTHFDRDNSGTLDREEVISALLQTLAIQGKPYDAAAIRESVYGVWSAFDHDGSGHIDRREFCAPGGLGESLMAITGSSVPQSAMSSSSYPAVPQPSGVPYVPQPSGVPQVPQPMASQQQNYNNPPPMNPNASAPAAAGANDQKMGVPVPRGMTSGQRIQVQTGTGMMEVTIPPSSEWKYNNSEPYFIISTAPKPTTPLVPMVQATPVVPSYQPSYPAASGGVGVGGYNPHGYQHQQEPMIHQQPFSPFESFHITQTYHPPPLRMMPVQPHELHQQFVRPTGRCKALLIGINYKGTRSELRGCANDAINMKRMLLQNTGWKDDTSSIVLLSDDQSAVRSNNATSSGGGYNQYGGGSSGGNYSPTAANIRKGFHWLVHNTAPGDVLFFHFSGHGAQVRDKTGMESDGYNETILPMDFKRSGQISDDEIWGTLVYPLQAGVKLTSVMDCCHSGTGLDLPLDWNIKKRKWKEDVNPAYGKGDVVLFSGCEDDQTSADVQGNRWGGHSQAGGAMTQSFLSAVQENPMPTYDQFISSIRRQLSRRGFQQRPQLTSNQRFDIMTRIFSLGNCTDGRGDILPNSNHAVGRQMRKKIKKGKFKKHASMDGIAAGLAMGIGAGLVLDAIF